MDGEFGENPDPKEERYERYLAESVFFRKMAEEAKYESFYSRGKSLDFENFDANSDEKRRILEEEFPRRFGRNGKQPLSKYDNLQVGALFKNMMVYSEKRINR